MNFIRKFLCRLLLVIDSTILVIAIFILKSNSYKIIDDNNSILGVSGCIFGIFVFIIILTIVTAKLAIKLTKYLTSDNLNPPYKNISDINSSYLAAYLGYFFISLSINDYVTLAVIYLLLLLVAYKTINQYYNPIFVLMGYKFYSIKTGNDIVMLVITKRYIRADDTLKFEHLRRIHDGCYFDEEE